MMPSRYPPPKTQLRMAHGRGDDGLSRITTRNASARGQHWSLELIISPLSGPRFVSLYLCFICTLLVLPGEAVGNLPFYRLAAGIHLFKASNRSLPGGQTISQSVWSNQSWFGGWAGWTRWGGGFLFTSQAADVALFSLQINYIFCARSHLRISPSGFGRYMAWLVGLCLLPRIVHVSPLHMRFVSALC